jgi:hypothetical protein
MFIPITLLLIGKMAHYTASKKKMACKDPAALSRTKGTIQPAPSK